LRRRVVGPPSADDHEPENEEAAMTSPSAAPRTPDCWSPRTTALSRWPVDRVRSLKGTTTVSVVLPALDEQETVGDIVAAIRAAHVDVEAPLVDEIVVLDSGSTDATADVAAAAGARVVHRDDVLPHVPSHRGKGEAMWRSLLATEGDLIVFIDADLRAFSPAVIPALLGPLLADTDVSLVKGFYERSLRDGNGTVVLEGGGGRVTELVARPLLALHWPELAGLVQPLAGEYAARRSLLEQLPFACGYGVELAMLIDTLRAQGVDAIAQVDLGERHHRHQDLRALGRMAAELWQVALDRLDRDGHVVMVSEPSTVLHQFGAMAGDVATSSEHDVALRQRPPMITVPEYRDRAVHAARPV
jgi:glucosyl-3-phosphoglycerate synthase